MIETSCAHCHKKVLSYPSYIRKYCSDECYREATKGKVQGACPQCGKEFSYYAGSARGGVKIHCSRECQRKASQARVTANCPKCGKEFSYYRSWPRKYCSRRCAAQDAVANLGEYAKGEPSRHVQCEICGKEFLKSSPQIEATNHNFCSLECYGVHVSLNKSGENHPLWKGGPLPYYGPNWKQQRKNARYRDGYKCQRCGVAEEELGRKLDVHHKVPFRMFGIERYREANTLSNLISLCHPCHQAVEFETVGLFGKE